MLLSAKKLVKSSKPTFWACFCSGFCVDCLFSVDLFWILKFERGFSVDLAFFRAYEGRKKLLPNILLKSLELLVLLSRMLEIGLEVF